MRERPKYCPAKGIPMIPLILAVLSILAVGVVFNIIGHLVNK